MTMVALILSLIAQTEVEKVRQELEKLKADQDVLLRQLEVQVSLVEELTKKVEEYRDKLAKATSKQGIAVQELQYARQEQEVLRKDLADLEEKHVALARDKKRLAEKIRLIGKVTAVSAETGVAVISLGRDDGVVEPMDFTLHRDGKFVAKIAIDRVDAKWSAGRVTLKKDDVRVGDDVTKAVVAGVDRDDLRDIRRELDELRAQVRSLTDPLLPSWEKLGAAVEALTPELKGHLGLERGLVVRRVKEGSPAERAGLRAWDVLPDMTEAELAAALEKGTAIKIVRGGRR